MKKMLNDNLKVQKETLIGLGFILNNNISYKDVCVNIVAFEDRDCKPPQKLYHLKRNNSDKINQEKSCERVSLQTSKLLRY